MSMRFTFYMFSQKVGRAFDTTFQWKSKKRKRKRSKDVRDDFNDRWNRRTLCQFNGCSPNLLTQIREKSKICTAGKIQFVSTHQKYLG